MSINRKYAIPQKTSFLPALQGKRVDVQPGIAVYVAAATAPLVGVLIPKKCVPLSVDRHRLKRRIAAIAAPALLNNMVVVRVLKKVDAELDLSKLQAWFDAQRAQYSTEPPSLP